MIQVSTALLVLLFIPGIWLHSKVLSILRDRHVSKWRELGSPTLVKNNSPANSLAVLRFLWRREYAALSDRHLSRVCRTLSILYLVYTVNLVTLVALIFR
jgi:hypothetical protein